MFCAHQVAEFRPHVSSLRDAGVALAVIGSGAPHFARGFKERMQIDAPIYSDQERAAYRAASMRRGLGHMLHPGQLAKWREAGKYFRLTLEGDATQQGGVVIVLPDGSVPYRFHNRFPGDHADPETVVSEARKAVVAAR